LSLTTAERATEGDAHPEDEAAATVFPHIPDEVGLLFINSRTTDHCRFRPIATTKTGVTS
jgi:hypothetical protein